MLERVGDTFSVCILYFNQDPLFAPQELPLHCIGSRALPALSIFCDCQQFFWYDDAPAKRKVEECLDLKCLFSYPHGFERLYFALQNAIPLSDKNNTRSKLTASVFRKLSQLSMLAELIPAHKIMFKAELEKQPASSRGIVGGDEGEGEGEALVRGEREAEVRGEGGEKNKKKREKQENNDPKEDPLAIFCNWFVGHQCYKKCTPQRCGGLRVLKEFIEHEEGSSQKFTNFLKLQFMFHNKKAFHFSTQKPYSDRSHERNMHLFVQDKDGNHKFVTVENADLHEINDYSVQVHF